jgi:hypothetical protein
MPGVSIVQLSNNSMFVTLMPENFYLGAKGKRGVGWVGAWALFTVNNLNSDYCTVGSDHGSRIAKNTKLFCCRWY